jgi:hypothetical protein
MTLDEAILALTNARAEVGGEALLLMVDGLHVMKFPIGDGCVYVSDLPQPGDEDEAIFREAMASEELKDIPPLTA